MMQLRVVKNDFSVIVGIEDEGKDKFIIYVENELNRVTVAEADGVEQAQDFADTFLMNFVIMGFSAEDIDETA